MKNILFYTLIFTLFSLIGCGNLDSSYTKMKSYKQKTFEKSNKAIVFLDIVEEVKFKDGTTDYYPAGYILKQFDKENVAYNIESPIKQKFFSYECLKRDYGEHMLVLNPGIYYIDKISRPTFNKLFINQFSGPGIMERDIVYGIFKVNAGDVVNLGKIVIKNDKIDSYENDSDKLTKELNKHKKYELLEKVKQGQLYPRGSIIFTDKNGKIKLVHEKELRQYYNNLVNGFVKNKK